MYKLVAIFVFLGGVMTGCDSTPTSSQPEHVGRYDLVTIDGSPLPWLAFQDNDDTIEVVAAELLINADGTYSNSLEWRVTQGGTVEIELEVSTGTVVRSGDALTFTCVTIGTDPPAPCSTVHTGGYAAGRITVDLGAAMVYQKRTSP